MTQHQHFLLTGDWVSPKFIAAHAGCSTRHVRRWCEKGYLVNLGFKVLQDQAGRWYINLSDNVDISRLRRRRSFPSQVISSVA